MKANGKTMREVSPRSRTAWRKWLEKNHMRSESIWLVLAKKDSRVRGPSMAEAVEEALCFGWIDSRSQSVDAQRFKVTMSPRNPKSGWSAINKKRVKQLIADGKMTSAGMAAINAAKRSGTWTFLDRISRLEIPDDLNNALNLNARARKNFDAFPASARKALMHWIISARRAGTRTARIKKLVKLAARNIRANEWVAKTNAKKAP